MVNPGCNVVCEIPRTETPHVCPVIAMRRGIQVTKQRKEDTTWNELICPPSHLRAGRLEGATCDNRVWGMDMKGNESGIGFFVRRISLDITMNAQPYNFRSS